MELILKLGTLLFVAYFSAYATSCIVNACLGVLLNGLQELFPILLSL